MAFPQSVLPIVTELAIGEAAFVSGSVPTQTTESSHSGTWSTDKAAYDITGDLDVRIEVTALDWTPQYGMFLASKNRTFGLTSSNMSWTFFLTFDGKLQLQWSPDGTFGSIKSAASSVATGFTDNTRHALRATLDVNNGASGYTVTFYTASDINGTYTQLGSTVTATPTTSIAATAADLEVGTTNDRTPGLAFAAPFIGLIHAFQLRNGIGGTRVAAIDFSKVTPGAEEYTDLEGNTWFTELTAGIQRAYVDVSGDPREKAAIHIGTRGLQNESSLSNPSSCSFELDNRDGAYSPRNPNSPYYGILGRNTPMRVSVGDGLGGALQRLALNRPDEDYVFAYDNDITNITNVDVRCDLDMTCWNGQAAILAFKWRTTGDQRSWVFAVDDDGTLLFAWSSDGTSATQRIVNSTVPMPLPDYGRRCVAAVLNTNFFGSNTVTFYTAPTNAGPFTQLGDTVTGAGTHALYDSTSEIVVGGGQADYAGPAFRQWYAFELRDGLNGTLVAPVDFKSTSQVLPGGRLLVDSNGSQWFLCGQAEITDQNRRFSGEISEWPQRWDPTGTDVSTPVEAAGILRRLGQGNSPLQSTLNRGLSTFGPDVIAYWPCEDGANSTSLASALPNHPAMAFNLPNRPDLASYDKFACSQPIPSLKNSSWTGYIPDYEDVYGEIGVWCLLNIPTSAAPAGEEVIFRIWTSNATVPIWQLSVDTSGNLRLLAVNAFLSVVLDTGLIGFGVLDRDLRISVTMAQNGADIDYTIATLEVGVGFGNISTGTVSSVTLGKASRLDVDFGKSLDGVAIGQFSVFRRDVGLFNLLSELNAYKGEYATDRMVRLCDENGELINIKGSANDTMPMGYQLPASFLSLLRECEATDGGVLHEARDHLGLQYRTRGSIYALDRILTPATFVYNSAHLSSIQPTDDDQYTRNDITAKVNKGSSARVSDETGGPLSVDRVGRYDDQLTVNVGPDGRLFDAASWALHKGTTDEARYPSFALWMERAPFVASASLTATATGLDVGDWMLVTNPPAWLPPETIRQVVIGQSEYLHNFAWQITTNCAPASVYDVGVYEDTESRYESDGSWLGADATSGATSITVATPSGPVWANADLPYSIIVDGEKMTVTGVSGTTSPQTFTVTRAVNGISKAHDEGAEVRLFRRSYYGVGPIYSDEIALA